MLEVQPGNETEGVAGRVGGIQKTSQTGQPRAMAYDISSGKFPVIKMKCQPVMLPNLSRARRISASPGPAGADAS